MKEQTQGTGRPKDRLFVKVYFNYALIMTLFAVITGVVFIRMYRTMNTDSNRTHMLQQAESISKQIREYQINMDLIGGRTYLAVISTLDRLDLWVVSNPSAAEPLNALLTNVELSGVALAEEQLQVINAAFLGNETGQTYYSSIHGYTIMSVSVPIYNQQGEVCGAVLINTEMASIDRGIANMRSTIFASVLIALAVSFVVALVFVSRLTGPFSRMRTMALRLADGDYEVKTGIDRKDEIGDLARTLDFLTDKLKENEIERENLEHMRMDFFANVSHELRTPITVVRAYTESLVDKVVTEPERVEQYYSRMLSECKSMERLVGDLLTLSKMQNPDFAIEKEPVNVMQIFTELSRTAAKIAEGKNVTVEIQSDRDICMMYGDYDRLRQMFLVILDNAVKFSNENGVVTVRVENGEKLVIRIRDHGIGIAPEEVPYVFDKFYKSKLRQNATGSGLGLAIARQIAVKHDGTIEVSSALGEGTEFVFTFEYICENDLN